MKRLVLTFVSTAAVFAVVSAAPAQNTGHGRACRHSPLDY